MTDAVSPERKWTNIRLPRGSVTPYQHTDRTGKTWDKAICNIPKGTIVGNIDVGGYSFDVFRTQRMSDQIAADQQVVVGIAPTKETVEIFKGKGEKRQALQVTPEDLNTGITEWRERYKEAKAQEADQDAPTTTIQTEIEAVQEGREARSSKTTDIKQAKLAGR